MPESAMVRVMGRLTIGSDPYRVLGVGRHASIAEIHRAYRRLARRYHPDGGGVDGAEMARINDAWRTLRDPAKRAEWDCAGRADPSSDLQWHDSDVGGQVDDDSGRWRRRLRLTVAAMFVAWIFMLVAIVLIGFGRVGVSSTP